MTTTTLQLKHTARWRTTVTTKDGRVVQSDEGDIRNSTPLSWEMYSLIYNAAGVSGGVLWQNPTTGELYPDGLSYKLDVPIDPSDLLEPGELCGCPYCVLRYEGAELFLQFIHDLLTEAP